MAKTSIEWLIEELNNIKAWTKNDTILSKADMLIEQAKEMYKQEQENKFTEEEVLNIVEKFYEIYGSGLGVVTEVKKQKTLEFIQSIKQRK